MSFRVALTGALLLTCSNAFANTVLYDPNGVQTLTNASFGTTLGNNATGSMSYMPDATTLLTDALDNNAQVVGSAYSAASAGGFPAPFTSATTTTSGLLYQNTPEGVQASANASSSWHVEIFNPNATNTDTVAVTISAAGSVSGSLTANSANPGLAGYYAETHFYFYNPLGMLPPITPLELCASGGASTPQSPQSCPTQVGAGSSSFTYNLFLNTNYFFSAVSFVTTIGDATATAVMDPSILVDPNYVNNNPGVELQISGNIGNQSPVGGVAIFEPASLGILLIGLSGIGSLRMRSRMRGKD